MVNCVHFPFFVVVVAVSLSVQISKARSASCTWGSVGRAAQWGTTLQRSTPAYPAPTTVSCATAQTSARDARMATS